LRHSGKIFAITTLLAGAAYAGSEADPQDSLDSMGQMVLEAGLERTPVSYSSHSAQMDACEAEQEALAKKMAGLREFLALSDEQLTEMTLRHAPDNGQAYDVAIASLEIEVRREAERRRTALEAVSKYRAVVENAQSAVSNSVSAKVIADVEAAIAAAEAALEGL